MLQSAQMVLCIKLHHQLLCFSAALVDFDCEEAAVEGLRLLEQRGVKATWAPAGTDRRRCLQVDHLPYGEDWLMLLRDRMPDASNIQRIGWSVA